MIAANRKDVRAQFAGLLSTALTGGAGLVQSVYAYRKGDFKGEAPVVTVSSSGTERNDLTFMGTKPTYQLQVDVFVLYADDASGWTEAMAEDRLDDIEHGIAGVVAANKVLAGYWEGISMTGQSERVDVSIGGVDYIREYMTLIFE
jgi:hypothetical protein